MALGIVLIGVPADATSTIAGYMSAGHDVLTLDIAEDEALDAGLDRVRAALATLAERNANGKVAVVGYGHAGRYAFLALTRLDADAAAGFYPSGLGPYLKEAPAVRKPLSLHFGDADENVPFEEVRAAKGWLEGIGIVEIYRYPGAGHGFALPGHPGFQEAAAAEARRRVEAFLGAV